MPDISFINIHCHKAQGKYTDILNIDQRHFENIIDVDQLFSVGLHPWFLKTRPLVDQAIQLDVIINKYSPIAIGECGLDKVVDVDWDLQLKAFLIQVSFSEKYKRPLIIHCVRAFNEIINYKKVMNPQMPWVIHGFNKKETVLKSLLEAGFYISLGDSILKKEEWLIKIVDLIPLEKLFFETDDKDINIESVYKSYANTSKIALEDLKSQIQKNYKSVFSKND